MRRIYLPIALSALLTLVGCQGSFWSILKKKDEAPPPPAPGAVALVEYLNNNAGRVQSLSGADIDLTCSQGIKSIGLMAKMVAQKPRNFRMGGVVLGKDVVDLGSNDQEFWWWIDKSDPYQFFCSYKDWNEGKVQGINFPFQPEWIMEAMGLGPYGPPEKYQVESDANTIKLVEKVRSPQGKTFKKVIVFNRRPQAPPNPQVMEYKLIDDGTGKDICVAQIQSTQLDKTTNAILPARMEFRWPEMNVKMAMRLENRLNVNPVVPAVAFERKNLTGIPPWNIANGPPHTANLMQVRNR